MDLPLPASVATSTPSLPAISSLISQHFDRAVTRIERAVDQRLQAFASANVTAFGSGNVTAVSSITPIPAVASQSTTAQPVVRTNAELNPSRKVDINGQSLTFNYSDLPVPPALSFGSDIENLAQHWGDVSSEWAKVKAHPKIAIKGTPIPLGAWKLVYSGWARGLGDLRWKGNKGPWVERKYLVAAYRKSGSVAQFWKDFSSADGHLTFTDITKLLRERRKAANSRIVELAKEKYGSLFNSTFSYRKSGKRYVMTRPHVIARRYIALKNELPDDLRDLSCDSDDD
ncbi:hypothetical protein EXIGLDRAFT_835680 [Exidia glandulosa HHB12029]|uniref:Uncharacterized protein n=1 Tax=Exidia glandulosa HHB12029 TaxID=1314781 RepID=A0A165IJP4_EXIGL|nr:hypothetical protein EXIGLDRAFT_835680 [Exidia glandulosa HHB12029]